MTTDNRPGRPLEAPFHNRAGERRVLRQAMASRRAELLILYGRRGVGKSALLEHALSEQGAAPLFYRATRRTLPLQMQALTNAAREAFPAAFIPQVFESFAVFLQFLSHTAGEQATAGVQTPVTVVIDELPYLADIDPGLLTTLQHWWDANKRRPNLKVFLSGSYLAFMERSVLDVNAPLYNRRTGAMKLEPMDYADSALFFPQYSVEAKMQAYAILGGMPSYLEQFDPERSIEENMKATALQRNTYLAEEPDWLLLEDLRKDAAYGSILRAIAQGERKPSDIARAIGRNSAQDVSPALAALRELGIIIRETPVTGYRNTRSRTSLYFLADNYLDFWYRFIDPNRSLLARGMGARLWERVIAPALQEYVSRPAFERACRQYLRRALAAGSRPALPAFAEVGTWWGAGDREIDVVATEGRGHIVLAGSCKWTTRPVDVADYAALKANTAIMQTAIQADSTRTDSGPALALFSRSGFTPRLKALRQEQDGDAELHLVDLEEMYRV